MKKYIFMICLCAIYSQVSAQSFRGFSFEQMAAPLLMAKQFQEECLANLESIADNIEGIEYMIDKKKDPVAWNLYTNCYNSITNAYNNIIKNGTNQFTRGTISNLNMDSKTIRNKITNAYNKRIQKSNEQYMRLQSSPGLCCDCYYSEMSLDDFIDGNCPQVKYYFPNEVK